MSRIVPKHVKWGPLGVFLTSILLQNRQKNEGWTLRRYLRKVSQSRNKFAQKILVMAGLEPMSFCLSDLEKAVVAKWQWSSVTQFSVSAGLVPTYKIYKICQFVGLKKKEVTTIVCVFLQKAPTKKSKIKKVFKSKTRSITKKVYLFGMHRNIKSVYIIMKQTVYHLKLNRLARRQVIER